MFDDGPAKPVRIWSRVGAAAGARRAATPTATSRCCATRPGCKLLILHDDAEREFDYTTGAEDALAQDFTVVSVKRDWATVFADQP